MASGSPPRTASEARTTSEAREEAALSTMERIHSTTQKEHAEVLEDTYRPTEAELQAKVTATMRLFMDFRERNPIAEDTLRFIHFTSSRFSTTATATEEGDWRSLWRPLVTPDYDPGVPVPMTPRWVDPGLQSQPKEIPIDHEKAMSSSIRPPTHAHELNKARRPIIPVPSVQQLRAMDLEICQDPDKPIRGRMPWGEDRAGRGPAR